MVMLLLVPRLGKAAITHGLQSSGGKVGFGISPVGGEQRPQPGVPTSSSSLPNSGPKGPLCFSKFCTCGAHCLECPSQPLWGHLGLSLKYQLRGTSSLTWPADPRPPCGSRPLVSHGIPSPGLPRHPVQALAALFTGPCYHSSSCLPDPIRAP